jgi:DNA repair protein RecO (recombination protein O)
MGDADRRGRRASWIAAGLFVAVVAALWPQLMVRFELRLLGEVGFGLDLERCAATGERNDLVYVSPKSGSAVSAAAGEPYKDKLLKLPAFLLSGKDFAAPPEEVADGFALTGYFLEKYVYAQHNAPLPPARQELLRLLVRSPMANPGGRQ